jgi:hypothetical protein
MGLREAMMRALRSGDEAAVRHLATTDRRAMRHLFGRLWDPDESIRRRAADGVGWAAAAHPDQGRTVLRKVLWSLNDESATNGVYAIPALAAVAHRAPELARPFVQPMASYAWDDGLRPAIEEALESMAAVLPEEVAVCRRRIYHGAAGARIHASSSTGRRAARKGDQRES